MNIKDTITLVGNELYTFFGASGSRQAATITDLSKGVRIELDDLDLIAIVDGQRDFIEQFATPATARNAFEAVRSAIAKRQHVRRAAAIGRGLAKYVVVPLGLVLFGLAMNVAVHGASHPTSAVADYRAPTSPVAALYSPPSAAASPASALQLAAPPERIAAALESGVQAGKFTIKIGSANGSPVYTFEDPLCTHCQEMAPELTKLAESHAVYVFPVSVIGGDDSAKAAASALCTKDRAKGWELAQSGASTVSLGGKKPDAATLKACTDEVNANNAIFHALGLRYTPTVFSAKGDLYPSDSPATAEAIEKWLTTEG